MTTGDAAIAPGSQSRSETSPVKMNRLEHAELSFTWLARHEFPMPNRLYLAG